MSFNNFLKHVDPPTHKQYSLEKFKEGHSGGRNFVVEEPEFKFEAPKFKKKIHIISLKLLMNPKESDGYLTA